MDEIWALAILRPMTRLNNSNLALGANMMQNFEKIGLLLQLVEYTFDTRAVFGILKRRNGSDCKNVVRIVKMGLTKV